MTLDVPSYKEYLSIMHSLGGLSGSLQEQLLAKG